MKNVEKNTKHTKNRIFMIFLNLSIIVVFCAFFSLNKIFATEETDSSKDFIVKKNENPIDIDKILEENSNSAKQEELTIEETDLEYTTVYRNNSDLPTGTIQVVQEGRTGKQNSIVIKAYNSESELVSEEIVANTLIKSSVNKIVEVGTGSGTNTYKATVKDKLYVTSATLAVRTEPSSDSDKICTLRKDAEVTILQILDNWYYISSSEGKGYIPKDCVTNINPNTTTEVTDDSTDASKSELLKNLSFDMNLNKISGLSLSQFEKLFENESQDVNGIFKNNARYFYYAEKQYNINGVFLASVAIHESGWGTSNIALNKKNLFGYGAYDSNPYGGAYEFSTYAEGIDLLARVFVKYYLNPAGTSIYDGETATGKFYSGNTLTAVNSKYASDKNWASAVYKYMQYLYNKL